MPNYSHYAKLNEIAQRRRAWNLFRPVKHSSEGRLRWTYQPQDLVHPQRHNQSRYHCQHREGTQQSPNV
jgi:hypothetical protein